MKMKLVNVYANMTAANKIHMVLLKSRLTINRISSGQHRVKYIPRDNTSN